MTDVYVYADEYGDLDFSGNPKAARYFGIGTATFVGDHGTALAEGLALRCQLEAEGVSIPRGFHAVNDSARTRREVLSIIKRQYPRIDTTFLSKSGAYPRLRTYTKAYLYKLSLFMHLKYVVPQVFVQGGRVFVILGSLQTAGKREAVKDAVADVCNQVVVLGTPVIPCIWDAPSSWGIQVADYGLWTVQRDLERGDARLLDEYIRPSLASRFLPWGFAAN